NLGGGQNTKLRSGRVARRQRQKRMSGGGRGHGRQWAQTLPVARPKENPARGSGASADLSKPRMQESFVMNKPTLQAVDLESPTDIPAPNPFDPANLRLDQSYTENVGVKKLITNIPVKKPNKQTFFRIHPGEEWRDNFPMIDFKDEGEEYIVA